jgi:serine/threonine-protein kinase
LEYNISDQTGLMWWQGSMLDNALLNDRYQLLELVGSGGMAVVYRGVDLMLQRQVAIKILREGYASDPSFLTRFQREAQAAARLHHPNIVTVYDVGQDGDCNYIVMEYVDGQDLKTLIRREERLGVDRALDVAIQICAGAGHAHRAGVIHCDIKPQNVLLTREGVAKVTDFGISRALSELGLTEAETVWGSPLYFSPEQAAGEPPSPASDVYSIGIILYEMLAGVPPFQAEKSTALALMHMRAEPPPLMDRNPQVGSQLEWLIRKVLAKEPSARYRTAEQMAYVLQEYRKRGDERTGWQPAATAPDEDDTAMGEPRADEGPAESATAAADPLVIVLGVIAFIAVVGLIPLWLLVYQAYSAAPALTATPTSGPLATLTRSGDLVEVPAVVGQPVEEAQRSLQARGLRYVVEERVTPGAQQGVVLEQTPRSGDIVAGGSEVTLIVSRSGRELVMPDVVGYQLDLVRDGLQSDDMQVRVEEVWSQRAAGIVLGQEPGAGAVLFAGNPVTLTVSGPESIPIPLEVNLAERMVLVSAQIHQKTFRPGDVLRVTLRWEALQALDVDYKVFVHLIGPGGGLVSQQDARPALPTPDWTPGAEVVDLHQLDIPTAQASGRYQLRVGMYPEAEPGSRLPVVDPGRTTVDSNSILIIELQIGP